MTFTLKAQPGQIVRIAHLNPDGKKVAWVFPNGSTRSEDDEPITPKNRGADESGTVSWSRPGTLDLSGSWTVRVVFDPFTETPDTVDFRYMLDELEVEGKAQDSIHLGIDLGVINHGDFSTYYSKSVPAAIALDSSSRLQFPIRRLSEIWGSNAVPNPDLYITGTLEEYTALFEYVVGTSTTWQWPFYRSPRSRRTRDRPGVYVPLGKYPFEAGRHMILSHEHAHTMFYGMSVVKRPPNATWVNEGLAVWSEYEAGLEDGGELEVSRSKSRSVNRARSAVHSGNLFAMFDLESGKEWSGRTDDQRSLQYAQAYMAMRYMIERFGLPKVIDFASNIGTWPSLGQAFNEDLGFSYARFESNFIEWLKSAMPSDLYYDRAEAHYDDAKYKRAVSQYSAAIERSPYHDRYFRGRGWAYYYLGQFEDALRDAELALGLDRFDPSSHNLRGWALYELGDYTGAISGFSRAIELDPQADYFRGRGRAYDELAQHGLAIANFEAAIRIDKNYAQVYLNRGWVYFDLERYQESLLDGSRAIELEPENRWGYRLRGRSLYRLERYEEAILDFDRALKVDPHQWVYFDRGRTNYKLTRYDEALLDFDAAIRIDPEYTYAYDWRAATHDKLGNEAQKIADRQKVCSIDNTFRFC